MKELDVFHTHFVSKAWLESNHLPLSKKKKPVALAKYINKIIASPGKQVKIVSLVRDPVSKTISQLFQTPEAFGTTHDDLLKMDVNAICHLLTDLKREQFSYPCEWFDSEFFEFTGIDIYQEPFDHASHCQVESFKQFDVLVLRAEDLSDEALILQNIKKIVHKRVEAERLMVSNTTTQKKTGELYKKVKQSIKFTRDFLDQLYSSKYCRHFYTDEELDMFKRRWCQ
ncbi:MAG: putative capsular polysaccharide synthesis family protein [Cyanobacteria bacterium J06614_10]